jgi:pimeloyl-ACP methyl ester carboxylesterase
MSGLDPASAAPVDGAPADLDGFSHHFTEVNGTRIHYVSGGTGSAIVLLHGWPLTWREWRGIMPALADAGFTVIAPDLRGLGDSEKPSKGYDKKTVADDIRAIVRDLGFEAIDLVGTDIGMMVAVSWALHHPTEIRRLVLAESLIPGFGLEELMNPATGGYWHFGFHAQVDLATMLTEGKEAEYLGNNWKMFSPLKGITADDRKEFLRTYGNPDGMRAGFRHYAAMLDDGKANRAAFKHKLTIPVLVLNAGLGIPQEQTLSGVSQVFANVEHDKVLLAGHAFAADRPDWTADRIVSFLETVSGQDKDA